MTVYVTVAVYFPGGTTGSAERKLTFVGQASPPDALRADAVPISRSAAGTIGIAAFGAVAGSPTRAGFIDGFHAVALGAATLYVAAAALVWAAIPSRASRSARHS